MSGAGHINDMNARIRDNLNLNSKRGKYFKNKRAYLKITRGEKISFRALSPEELKVIRKKVIREKRRVLAINYAVVAISVVGLIALLFWLF